MKITEVRINKMKKNQGSLRAFASVTFDKEFVVTGLKVVKGKKGMFVSMPSVLGSDKEYHDSCFPLTKEFREKIEDAVLNEYEQEE